MLIRCEKCGTLGRRCDHPCEACDGSGFVEACLNCNDSPRDPLFAPACSGACRDAWEAKEARARLELGLPPLVTRAP